jgi:CRISPR/Cas system-associated exonuclease Cas4 (RecB family)
MPIPIQNLIDEHIREEFNQRGKKEQSSWYISKLGGCLRGVFLERLGKESDEPFDNRTLRVFNAGNIFEDWVVNLLEQQKDVKLEKQTRVEDKELGVSGYVDAIVEYQGEKRPYEIKSKHSRSFWYMVNKQEGPMRHHEYQLWMYLKLLNISEGSLLYISKDDLTVAEFIVQLKNRKLEKEVMHNLKILNDCWKTKTLPPLPDPKSWQAKFCGYHKQCLSIKNEDLDEKR